MVDPDPFTLLTVGQVGTILGGLSEDAVLQLEREGRFFAVSFPQRGLYRVYPAFQFWPEVAGELLAQVMLQLGDGVRVRGPDAYGFFSGADDLLGGATALEVMLGRLMWERPPERPVDPAVHEVLKRPADERLSVVLRYAKTYAQILRGW
jgi:hypothetical protein